MKLLLTAKETAEAVSMSESKIRRLIIENRFPAPVAIDGNVRWRMRDLNAWEEQLANNKVPPAQTRRGRPRLSV